MLQQQSIPSQNPVIKSNHCPATSIQGHLSYLVHFVRICIPQMIVQDMKTKISVKIFLKRDKLCFNCFERHRVLLRLPEYIYVGQTENFAKLQKSNVTQFYAKVGMKKMPKRQVVIHKNKGWNIRNISKVFILTQRLTKCAIANWRSFC